MCIITSKEKLKRKSIHHVIMLAILSFTHLGTFYMHYTTMPCV